MKKGGFASELRMKMDYKTLFDAEIDRLGSGSYKWDSPAPEGTIPLWVADMDFRTAPAVIEALERRVSHGVFGYTLVDDGYYKALTDWFLTRHGYSFTRDQVIYTSGVVPAISAIIKALTRPGDGVIVQTPVYNCFFSSIRNNGCRIVENPLIRQDFDDRTFTYRMDYQHLEELTADASNSLLLLCNPHNPAGRAWTSDELRRVAEICRRHGVRVVSDEIHCELTAPDTAYTPYGTVDSDVNQRPEAIVCLSPSKAFNTAGLQIANVVCPDDEVKALVDKAININEVCDVNPFGVVAHKASYSPQGEEWLTALREYLFENYRFMLGYLLEHLPLCKVTRLEATYLPWVDVSDCGIPSEAIEERLMRQARVWVNAGEMYGKGGFIRLNIACPRTRLEEGLRRMCGWFNSLTNN